MSKNTLPLLLEHGILQIGDVLEADRQCFRDSSKILNSKVDAYSDNANFWRCQITEHTIDTQEVKYLRNDRYYRLTSLITLIAEHLTDQDYVPGAVDYWLHPRHGNMSLWELREQLLR